MAGIEKNQEEILEKLKIEKLNDMQIAAHQAIYASDEVVLSSPTGTGKTLAYLLPMINGLSEHVDLLQALIIVPARELAVQIHQVMKEMGSGYRFYAFYGGRSVNKDRIDLASMPTAIVGTPGRIADHIRRGRIETKNIKTLILDEYDKSIEIGYEDEMKQIVDALTNRKKTILTSATKETNLPDFIALDNPHFLDWEPESEGQLAIRQVVSLEKDKIETLAQLISALKGKRGIIFLNYKDAINRVISLLGDSGIKAAPFNGSMEQRDRETSLIKFRNGTTDILVATDLAARGIDVPELDFIIHYHLPMKEEEFIHRNGRTARVGKSGIAYVLRWENENLPDYMPDYPKEEIPLEVSPSSTQWTTIHITAGRRDKVSKGDVAGFIFKQGELKPDEVGLIELYRDESYAAIHVDKLDQALAKLNNEKLKNTKVRVREV